MHEIPLPDLETAIGDQAFLRGLARSLLGRDDRADDLVQEAYVAVLEGGPEDPGRRRGWMAGVMRRRAAALWRKRGVEERNRSSIARRGSVPSAADVAEREEIRRAVVAAMLAVGEPSRSVLVLRYYEGLPPREVAARLGVPVETVRTRTRRGLEAMRGRLDKQHGTRSAWAAPLAGAAGIASASGSAGLTLAFAIVLGVAALAGAVVLLVPGIRRPAPKPAPVAFGEGDGQSGGVPASVPAPKLAGRGDPAAGTPATGPRAGHVRGRVVDKKTRRALAGLRVYGHRQQGRHLDTWSVEPVRTDRNGGFELVGLPAGDAMVYAVGDGWCSERLAEAQEEGFNPCMIQVPAAGIVGLVLQVTPTATVEGRVTDMAGRPLAGLRVVARLPGHFHTQRDAESPVFESNEPTVTDSEGHFSMRDLPPGALWQVCASGPAVLDAESEVFTPEAGQIHTVELRAYRRLKGRELLVTVLDEESGLPMEGVKVVLYRIRLGGRGSESIGPRGTTDSQGQVRIAPLTDAPVGIRLSGAMIKRQGDRPIPVELGRTRESTIIVRVRRSDFLAGRVVLPAGVEPLLVDLEAASLDHPVADRVSDIFVQPDSTFAFRVPAPGRWTLVATGSDSGREIRGEVIASVGGKKVEIVLAPVESQDEAESKAASAEGTTAEPWVFSVVGPDDKPIPSVQLRRITAGGHSGWGLSGEQTVAFRFTGTPETFAMEAVEARDADAQRLQFGATLLGPFLGTPQGGSFVLRMGPERVIHGLVRIDGKPAPKGLVVKALPSYGGEFLDWRRSSVHAVTRTDANGAFSLGGLGDYDYEIVAGGLVGLLSEQPPVFAAGSHNVAVELRRAASAVVTVLGQDGRPLVGVRVHARAEHAGSAGAARKVRQSDSEEGHTDAGGRVSFIALDPLRTYSLEVVPVLRVSGYWGTKLEGWKPEDTILRLQQSLAVAGVVRLPDGSPFEGATIKARGISDGSRHDSGRTDRQGRFVIPGFRQGVVEVYAELGQMRSQTQTVAAGTRDLDFVLGRGVHLRARIEGWSDLGPTKARSQVFGASPNGSVHPGRQGDSRHGQTFDRQEGTFDLPGREPGASFTLYVGPLPGGRIAYRTGILLDKPEVSVGIPLMSGGTIHGTFPQLSVDPARLYIRVTTDEEGQAIHIFGTVRADGSFRIDALPPGPLTALVVLKGAGLQRTKSKPIPCQAGDELTLTVPGM